MKIRYLLVLLVIILVSSCATQEEAPEETTPAAPTETAPEPEPPAEEPTEIVEPEVEEAGPTTEVEIMYAGFEPKELTVQKGTTIKFTSIQGKHKITVNGKGSPNIEEEGSYEYLADSVGKLRVFNIFTKKTMMIEVVEELTEATE